MALFSDDFEDATLDARWVEADPGNDTTWTEAGGTVTAASADFDDAYSGAAQNPRLLQAHDGGDFDVAVRCAEPSSTALGVGLWVDDGTDAAWLRWDLRTNLRDTFIAYRVGSRTIIENGNLGVGALFRWMRLTKAGTVFTCYTRAADDETGPWVQRQQFTCPIAANRVGIQVVAASASGTAAFGEFVDLLAGTGPEIHTSTGRAAATAHARAATTTTRLTAARAVAVAAARGIASQVAGHVTTGRAQANALARATTTTTRHATARATASPQAGAVTTTMRATVARAAATAVARGATATERFTAARAVAVAAMRSVARQAGVARNITATVTLAPRRSSAILAGRRTTATLGPRRASATLEEQ